MSTEQPNPEFIKRVEALEARFREMQDDISLSWARKAGDDLGAELRGLPASIGQLRVRGYAFRSFLERKADVLAQQWAELRPRIVEATEARAKDLRYKADLFQQRLPFLRYNKSEVELSAAEAALQDLEARIKTAGEELQEMGKTIEENVKQTTGQVKELAWVLDQAEGASFRLQPGESVVSAAGGQWMTSEKEGPKGVLFLTDERVLFERKEEVVTKKVLFVAKEKQKFQELQWEAPLGRVQSVQASEKGGAILGIGKKEILEFRFGGGTKVDAAVLRLDADSAAWQALIARAKSGDLAAERAIPKGQAAPAAAPAALKCAVCGATLTPPAGKAAAEVKCEFCGTISRL